MVWRPFQSAAGGKGEDLGDDGQALLGDGGGGRPPTPVIATDPAEEMTLPRAKAKILTQGDPEPAARTRPLAGRGRATNSPQPSPALTGCPSAVRSRRTGHSLRILVRVHTFGAPVTSTAASADTSRAALLAVPYLKALPSNNAGGFDPPASRSTADERRTLRFSLLYFCHPRPVNGYSETRPHEYPEGPRHGQNRIIPGNDANVSFFPSSTQRARLAAGSAERVALRVLRRHSNAKGSRPSGFGPAHRLAWDHSIGTV
jgi:hypothetical protein